MSKELKTFSIFLLFATCLVDALCAEESSVVEATAEPLFLNVETMIEHVKTKSPRVLFQKETVRRALEQSFQQRAALLPQLSIRAQQSRTQFGSGFTGGAFDGPPFDSFASRVVGSQTIFDATKYSNYRLAKLANDVAENDYEVAIQDILNQAVQLYFTHLRDLRQVEIVQSNIVRETELLNLARDQFDAGAAVKIDVTRAEVRLATEQRSLMESEALVHDSIMLLKALLDIDLDRELLLDRSIIEGIKSPPSLKKYATMEDLLELRPELESQQLQLDQARLERKAAAWQRLPNVELFGEWGYNSDEAFDGNEREGWVAGIRANFPIWEGGRMAAERREAKATERQREYEMRDLRNRIEREFRFAIIDMDSRYAQIEIARDEIRLGRDEVEQASERYREGLADNRELIDAQQRLTNAEGSHLRAIYLYGLSRLAFARAIGSVERVLE
ncbi:MAG: TolC family protein [Opitutaceae bacterium]